MSKKAIKAVNMQNECFEAYVLGSVRKSFEKGVRGHNQYYE